MQFVPDGPDLPEGLLRSHADGRLVFFCGAGVSMPAGLPSFRGLVERLYDAVGTSLDGPETNAFRDERYDGTLQLLERRLPGGRQQLRRQVPVALEPSASASASPEAPLDTHVALLQLSQGRDDAPRLVTTNFDRFFHRAAAAAGVRFEEYVAPRLPIPRASRWNGVAFLHGLLDENPDARNLDQLILTSGDFGHAYLVDGWAARFVGELAREFDLCFVGYSLADPVVRYMMDGLAAERRRGEAGRSAWWFVAQDNDGAESTAERWQAGGVAPILYAPGADGAHNSLHETLRVWAAAARGGVSWRARIAEELGARHPSASTVQDDFAGRLIWAISDPGGVPANRFADLESAPTLDWLFEFERRASVGDVRRDEGGALTSERDVRAARLPAESADAIAAIAAALSRLVPSEGRNEELGAVAWQLARWLTRHLADPRLLYWVRDRGAVVHGRWRDFLLAPECDRGEPASAVPEMSGARTSLSQPVDPHLRALWRATLAGRLASGRDVGGYGLADRQIGRAHV